MSEAATAAKAAKKEVVYTPIKMEDGRTVEFAGNRQVDKTVTIEDGAVSVRLDFRNGKSVVITQADLSASTLLQAAGHGISQKVGDSYASEKDVDDMFLAAEEMANRLKAGDWRVTREAGSSMAGASLVIKALVEHTGKSVEEIKAFLERKIAAGITRQALYAQFRHPGTPTGRIIKRLEEEKAAKGSAEDAEALLAEIG
jgi:hypothetical protein